MLRDGEGEGGEVQLVRKAPAKITSLQCVSLFTLGCRSYQKSFLLKSYLVSVKNCLISPLSCLLSYRAGCSGSRLGNLSVCVYINILYVASQLSLTCEGPEGDTPRYSQSVLYHDPADVDAVLI